LNFQIARLCDARRLSAAGIFMAAIARRQEDGHMIASVPEFPMRMARSGAPLWSTGAFDIAPASLTARIAAYLVDIVVVGLLAATLTLALFVLGFLSLGASWLLIAPAWAATPFLYSALTLSSRAQATLGMRLFGLHMRTMEGQPVDIFTGLAHAVLFYVFAATMTPLILLVGVFRHDKALLHDLAVRVRLVAAR
jgi:uncharacterized RDD family membrane protein YckC